MTASAFEPEGESMQAVHPLVEYDRVKGTHESPQMLSSGGHLIDGEEIACVDLLHRVWPSSNAASLEAALPHPAVLGDFRIVREIGRGGMGVVYEAEQISLRRMVALKILPHVAFLDEGRLTRFELEARTAATLEHPHIVPIYSVGCEQNVHYYAMQLIRGASLAELYAQRASAVGESTAEQAVETAGPLSTIDRPQTENCSAPSYSFGASRSQSERYFNKVAEWGRQAAEAIHFSHERGVVHRDIKPANLIIDSAEKLWITDFGLARLHDEAGVTCTGDLIGTLQYISPERLQGDPGADRLGDVYALGVTLYEMLSLQPAFEGGDRPAMLRRIIERDPRPLRQVDPWVPADLETIVAKAVEKEPSSRYLSAGELAADLHRYLSNQPILAKRANLAERALKWARRHKTLAHASLIFGGLLIALLGIALLIIQRSLRETADLLYMADVSAAYSEWGRGEVADARASLAAHIPSAWEVDRRGLEWQLLQEAATPPEHLELLGHVGPVNEIAVFPDRDRLASVGADGTFRIWELATGKLLRTVKVCDEPLSSVAISEDGKLAAVGSTVVYLCDLDDDGAISEVLRNDFTFESLAFSPDSQTLFAGARYQEVVKLSLTDRTTKILPSTARIETLGISTDGALLVPNRREGYAGSAVGVIQFVDPTTMEVLRELDASIDARHRGQLTVAKASICGRYVLAGEKYDSTAYLFESESGKRVAQTPVSRDRLTDVAIAPDGSFIGVGYRDGVFEVFLVQLLGDDVVINARPRIVRAHEGELLSMEFIDARLLATAGTDGAIRLWKLPRFQPKSLKCGAAGLTGVSLSPNGEYLAYTSHNGYGVVRVVDGTTTFRWRQPGAAFQDPVWASHSDQFSIVAWDEAALVTVSSTGAKARTTQLRERPEEIAYSPHGRELALVGRAHLSILDTQTGVETFSTQLGPASTLAVGYSIDGEMLAIGDETGGVTLLRLPNYQQVARFKARGETDAVCFSPDNRYLASGHRDGAIRLWDLRKKQLDAELRGHEVGVADVIFSNDGLTLVSASQNGIIRSWSVKHGRLFGVIFDPGWEGASAGPCRLDLTRAGDLLAVGYQNVPDDFVDAMLWRVK